MSKKANIVLVHGAWADGSCWSKVILLLQTKGYNVTAAQIPLTSLEHDIDVARRLVSEQSEPTVLVGHSYGGAVITGAATAIPTQVKALVYITAFGLDEGESLETLANQGPPSPGICLHSARRSRIPSGSIVRLSISRSREMPLRTKPLSWPQSRNLWRLPRLAGRKQIPAWKTLPSWYLVCTEDQDDSATRPGVPCQAHERYCPHRFLQPLSLYVQARGCGGHHRSRGRGDRQASSSPDLLRRCRSRLLAGRLAASCLLSKVSERVL